jgi:hypothetical protein
MVLLSTPVELLEDELDELLVVVAAVTLDVIGVRMLSAMGFSPYTRISTPPPARSALP